MVKKGFVQSTAQTDSELIHVRYYRLSEGLREEKECGGRVTLTYQAQDL